MNSLESFLEKYENNLDRIVFGGGWAVEIFQDRTHNPYRDHHDIDTLVLDENLKVENDSHRVPGRYFSSIDIESEDWLLDFIVKKQVVFNNKAYDVKALCPEFIAVSKAFSDFGVARTKDNKDIRHIFQTIDLDKEKIYNLIEKAKLLREESNFLEMMVEKGWETEEYSREDFNQKIFQEKYNIEKIPIHITSRILESYDSLFSNIKKRLGAGWIKNNKKRMQEILNNTDVQKVDNYTFATGYNEALIQKVGNYGLAIKDALKYSKASMKEDLMNKILNIPDSKKASTYGLAIKNALKYSEENMKEGLVDRFLNIHYGAGHYGWAIRLALEYAVDGVQEDLTDKIFGIPDSQKAMGYGLEIRDALEHTEKYISTQQQRINNIFIGKSKKIGENLYQKLYQKTCLA